jgi:phosphoglycolate phosphatase
MREPKYRAVIFDLDGTLIDSLEDIADSMNMVLKAKGYPTHTYDAYRYFVGSGARKLVAIALPEEKRDDDTVNECHKLFKDIYDKNWDVKTRPYPGIPEMLDRIAKLGIKASVLSNKPDDFTKRCVKKFLPDILFEIVLGMRENIPPKPDPAAALEIAAELKISPENFLYIGDTAIDMNTANNAGMFAVGVLWGFRSREELMANGAKALAGNPMEILNLLI